MSQLGFDMHDTQDMHEETRQRGQRRQRTQRRRTWGAVVVALALVAGILGVGFAGVNRIVDRVRASTTTVEDFSGAPGAEVLVEVKSGDSASDIAERLEAAGVVASEDAFEEAAQANSEQASKLQPGYYRLQQRLSGVAAFERMLDPAARAEARVTVPEGLRLEETFAALSKGTGIPVEQFAKAATSGQIGLPDYARNRPEGFLFPATYDVPPNATAVSILRQMTSRFQEAAQAARIASSSTFSPYEIVTIASLVEAEAPGAQDFGKVARVVHNRLDEPMRLQFDSTINYALKADKAFVLDRDTEVDSPYNTYENDGLPPGPIGSPGEKALAAAVNPPPGNELYFITVDINTGETKYTSTLEEFNALKRVCKAAKTC